MNCTVTMRNVLVTIKHVVVSMKNVLVTITNVVVSMKKKNKTIFFQVLQNIDKFFKETGVYIPYIFIGKDYIHQGSIFLIFSWIRITRNRGVY